MRSNEPGRTVTSRVLSVLGAFESHGPALSFTQLVEHTGLAPATAHRLVAELTSWGALGRDDQGRYHVGLRLWELAQGAVPQLRDTARPLLQDLFSLTQETAHLAVREGHEALYVDRVYSSKRVPRASRIGGRLPLHATAVGKVLLASEEPWFRDAYLAGRLEARTSRTTVDPVVLTEDLERISERGFAVTMEEAREGACSIAVPVRDPSGAVAAAIGLVLHAQHAASLTHHLPVLRGVAERIEHAIARLPLGGRLRA